MNSSDFGKKDLADLIRKAQAETQGRSSTKQAAAGQQRSTAKPLLWFGVFLVLLAGCGVLLWNELRPATRQQVTADLEHVLLEARASIEAFKAKSGRLPTALPNASLSSVVKYMPVRDKYVLVARSGEVHLVLFPDRDKPVQAGGR